MAVRIRAEKLPIGLLNDGVAMITCCAGFVALVTIDELCVAVMITITRYVIHRLALGVCGARYA